MLPGLLREELPPLAVRSLKEAIQANERALGFGGNPVSHEGPLIDLLSLGFWGCVFLSSKRCFVLGKLEELSMAVVWQPRVWEKAAQSSFKLERSLRQRAECRAF